MFKDIFIAHGFSAYVVNIPMPIFDFYLSWIATLCSALSNRPPAPCQEFKTRCCRFCFRNKDGNPVCRIRVKRKAGKSAIRDARTAGKAVANRANIRDCTINPARPKNVKKIPTKSKTGHHARQSNSESQRRRLGHLYSPQAHRFLGCQNQN